MKIADDKITISITFDEYESRLIREAARVACPCHDAVGTFERRRDYRFLIRWAIHAFCRSVIQAGEIVFPLAADLRPENLIEQRDRIAEKIPARGPGTIQTARWN